MFKIMSVAGARAAAISVPSLDNAEGLCRRRRVLSIMCQFPPSSEVGAQSCAQICRYLADYEWDPVVLTVQERYIARVDHTQTFRGTVIRTPVIPHPLSLYKRMIAFFRARGISPASTKSSDQLREPAGLRRWMLSMLELPDLRTGWILPALISGLAAVRRYEVRCLFSSGPWWTNHLVGLALAELTGLPWVAHFRDLWAQGHWLKPTTDLSIRLERALERRVIRKARAVICVTEMQTAMLREANPDLPPSKFITIPNGYDDAEWSALSEKKEASRAGRNRFVITYAGSLYHGRSPYPLFRALRSLIDSGEILREHVRVDLLGFCDLAEDLRVSDVVFKYGINDIVAINGLTSRPEALRCLTESALLLLLVDDQSYSIPAKTYEYLRAGRPILALTSDGGAVAELLNETGGAWVVNSADETAIKAAVMDAYHSWTRGTDSRLPDPQVVRRFDRRTLARRFGKVFDRSVASARPTVNVRAAR